jgi:hypothetical protein
MSPWSRGMRSGASWFTMIRSFCTSVLDIDSEGM